MGLFPLAILGYQLSYASKVEEEAQKEEDEGKVQVDCPPHAHTRERRDLEPALQTYPQLLCDVLQQDGACGYCLTPVTLRCSHSSSHGGDSCRLCIQET